MDEELIKSEAISPGYNVYLDVKSQVHLGGYPNPELLPGFLRRLLGKHRRTNGLHQGQEGPFFRGCLQKVLLTAEANAISFGSVGALKVCDPSEEYNQQKTGTMHSAFANPVLDAKKH
ncbi:hypothetical protein Ciccas_013580 [Cichlidogyrus casuarinus]|uniref:Uncharacterized protein n=1 Tax=Cichlidogyrus casuarinus TaxID=1844966 RepID=A0ABD2PK87_9PLAT